MAKQKPEKASKPKPTGSAEPPTAGDRRKRIERGREVFRRVNARVSEMAAQRTDALQGGSVQSKTRQKYRTEAIRDYADELGCPASELEIDVQLAELADKSLSEGLNQAILTGRLQLRRQALTELLKLKDIDELEKKLDSLLEDQI